MVGIKECLPHGKRSGEVRQRGVILGQAVVDDPHIVEGESHVWVVPLVYLLAHLQGALLALQLLMPLAQHLERKPHVGK